MLHVPQVLPPEGYMEQAYAHVRAAGGVCIADEVQACRWVAPQCVRVCVRCGLPTCLDRHVDFIKHK